MGNRVGRVVAAVAVVGAMVGGCGSGPSQTGSAVILGDGSIALATVQEEIAAALAPEKADAAAAEGLTDQQSIARAVVSDAVVHALLERRAAEEGIAVSDADVDAALAGVDPAASLYTGERLRQDVRDRLLAATLGAEYVDRLAVSLQVAIVPTEAEALALAGELAAGGPAADAALAALPQGTSRPLDVTAAQALGQFPLYPFGTPAGSVVVSAPPQEGLDYEVVRIVGLQDSAPSAPSVVDQIPGDTLADFGVQLLQGGSGDIRVNPRYGVWDPLQMRVVAEGSTLGQVVPPASGQS